ncbi:hypothetical protein INS49_008841 [Diaporthe citri]|uniref:uncharacterized protein n=1 Tax=Diaporthe citri TaxID=83186 RepID=UPI001C80C603|nr:uncharacterized protein INS49_008841 [Diaporthe citri]KAG6363738.1 hypothetical protein INS49_008841 [Diaporthe citri]
MDTTQPKGRLKAFFKHATIRISSTKDHGFPNDSASTHSIDDDGRSQRSSISGKKDSKLRRIGRGIREWRSKRKRLRGDTQQRTSFALEGKSFSSSEASLPEGSFEDEDFSDEDELVNRLGDHAPEASEAWRREAPDEKLPCEIIHEEVAVRQSAREHVTSKAIERQTQSGKEETLPQTSITLPPPPPIYSSLVLPDLAPRDGNLKPKGIVFRRDRKGASDFAQRTLSSEPALWTDASHRPVGLKSCDPEHHGGIAVAQKLDQRWTVHSAYTSGVTDSMQLESLAILMALQMAAQEKGSGTLGEGTVYICSDSDFSLQYIEKGLIRLSEQLDRWEVSRFSDYHRPEKNLAAEIGRRILKQYYELRRLGAWVELHWVPAHSGVPGNEIADRVAMLSRWWLAKVAPRPAQGTGLVMPLKVLTFDEPWTRYCPHKGQPQYSTYMALQLLEETKNLHVVISTKAIGPATRNTAIVGPDGLALQPASKSTCRLFQPPSAHPFPQEGIPQKVIPLEGISQESIAQEIIPEDIVPEEVVPEESIPLEDIPLEVVPLEVVPLEVVPLEVVPLEVVSEEGIPEEVVPEEIIPEYGEAKGPIPQPPPLSPQPKVRREKQSKKRPAAFENLLCVHCWHKGHLIHQCFEKFPEQKVAFPQRYARYVGRPRLEKVIPGAFHNIARLHPQLMPQAIHGQDSRCMVGRVGISPHLRWKYRWDEAQAAAQLDYR